MYSQFFDTYPNDTTDTTGSDVVTHSSSLLSSISHYSIIIAVVLIIGAGVIGVMTYIKRQQLFQGLIPELGEPGANLYMALEYHSSKYVPFDNLESAGLIHSTEKTVTDKEGKTSTSISRKWAQLQGTHHTRDGIGILVTPLPGSLTTLLHPNALVDLRLSVDSDIIPVNGGQVFIITKASPTHRTNVTTEG